jgi:DNA-binding FadR family transcriptional regulator
MLEPVSVTRLYRMIANQIKSKIEAGNFAPGARLPSERELAELLAVSRASVREALIALEIEGYVDVRVGTGVFVAERKEDGHWRGADSAEPAVASSNVDIGPFELLEARLLVEPQCAALAATHASAAQLVALREAVRAISGSAHPSAHDRSFHVAIAEASGNAALASTVANLWALRESSQIFSRLDQHFVTRKVWAIAEVEHDRILQAILARDPEAARAAMSAHMNGIRDRLHQDFSGDVDI